MRSIKDKGYAVMALPAEDVKPLTLLEKISKTEVLNLHSHIKDIFEPYGRALPSVTKDSKAPSDLKSGHNLDLSVGANVSFLKSLLRFFTGSASAGASYEKEKNMMVEFDDLRKDYVSIYDLDAYIQQAKVNVTPSFLEKLSKGELFVVTEILKTSHFTVSNEKKTDFKVKAGVKASEVTEVGVDTQVATEKDNFMEGSGEMTVGVKAYRIFSRDGKYSIKYADKVKVVRGEEFPGEKLTGEEGFLSIKN